MYGNDITTYCYITGPYTKNKSKPNKHKHVHVLAIKHLKKLTYQCIQR